MLKFAGHPSVPDRYSVFSSLCNPDTGHHGQKFQFNAFQSLLLEANWRPRLTTYPTPEIKRDLADKLSRIAGNAGSITGDKDAVMPQCDLF